MEKVWRFIHPVRPGASAPRDAHLLFEILVVAANAMVQRKEPRRRNVIAFLMRSNLQYDTRNVVQRYIYTPFIHPLMPRLLTANNRENVTHKFVLRTISYKLSFDKSNIQPPPSSPRHSRCTCEAINPLYTIFFPSTDASELPDPASSSASSSPPSPVSPSSCRACCTELRLTDWLL